MRRLPAGLLLIALLALPARAGAASEIKEIAPAGATEVAVTAVNSKSAVAGYAKFSDAPTKFRAFRWVDGVTTPLGRSGGTLSGNSALNSYGNAIDETGRVFGGLEAFDSAETCTLRTGSTRPVVWADATPAMLGGLEQGCGRHTGSVYGASDQGTFWAGYSARKDGAGAPLVYHAVTGQGGAVTDLTPTSTGTTYATDVNASGAAYVYTQDDAGPDLLAQGGTTTTLNLSGSRGAINDAGTVVGQSTTTPTLARHYSQGVYADLPPLAGSTESDSASINNRDETVGWSVSGSGQSAQYRATLWKGTTATDLNSLLPPNSGWQLQTAIDISDSGQVVGYGLKDGQPKAYLLVDSLVVNSTGDQADAASDGQCDVDPGTAGNQCTLRAAIQEANAQAPAAPLAVKFDIPGGGAPRISPASPLPPVTAPVSIDGTTQPATAAGGIGVQLDGAGAGTGAVGLVLKGDKSVVRGLAVGGFKKTGIELDSSDDVVAGDWIGVLRGASAFEAAPNGLVGVDVRGSKARVGGAVPADRVVVATSGDPQALASVLDSVDREKPPSAAQLESFEVGSGAGVRVADGGDGAVVEGNWFGLNPDGSRSGSVINAMHVGLPSGVQVVAPSIGSIAGVRIAGNVVTGAVMGINLATERGPASGVSIQKNVVGPDASGRADEVAGNGIGMVVGGKASGLVIGGAGQGNLIQGNGAGVLVYDTTGAAVSDNTLGTNAPLGEFAREVHAPNASLGLHNGFGALLLGNSQLTFANNRVLGALAGVFMAGSSHGTVRGNQIGYFPAQPTSLATLRELKPDQLGSWLGIADLESTGDVISGNSVSMSDLGTLAILTKDQQLSQNTFASNGLGILAGQASTQNSAIRGNTLIRNESGLLLAAADPTPKELSEAGVPDSPAERVALLDAPVTQPGLDQAAPSGGVNLTGKGLALGRGEAASAAANGRTGTRASIASSAPRISIVGNRVGTDEAGAKQGNEIGAWVLGSGGVKFGDFGHDGNTVAYNESGGLFVGPGLGEPPRYPNVFLRGNSFHDNGAHPLTGPGLGVDVVQQQGSDPVFGVNTNLPGPFVGPDGLQNYPTLAGAAGSGGKVRVVGTLNARKSTSYTVELFASARCSASGFGEGQTKVGGVTVSTDGNGEAPIDAKVSLPKEQRVITAMATGARGSSEFSRCLKPSATKSAGAALAPDGLTPSASGNVTVDVWCLDQKPCDGTATLDQTTQRAVGTNSAATARSPRGRLGASRFKARAGKRVKVKIKLSAASRKLLTKKHRLPVRATVKLKRRKGAAASHTIAFVLSRR